jgi:hypothetical protein
MLSAMMVQSSGLDYHLQDAPRGNATNILARISGKVFDVEGKPAFQLEVRLVKADDVDANPETVFAEDRRFEYIDQSGNYELQWVPPGRYILAVNADFRFGYQLTYYPDTQDITRAKVITVGPSENLQNIDIALPSPTLTRRVGKGLVTNADGRPVPGAHVTLVVAKYPWIAPSGAGETSGEAGDFSVEGFEGIEYLLQAWAEVGRDQYLHAEPLKIEFKAVMDPITVKITLPGKGLPNTGKELTARLSHSCLTPASTEARDLTLK